MAFLLLVLTLAVVVWVARAVRPTLPEIEDTPPVVPRVDAQGLILSASTQCGERALGGQRFEVRDLVLDVEIPGRAPYVVSVTAMIPRICEGRPGARLDLTVNPMQPDDVQIVGPAGSSAWLYAAPWLTRRW